MTIRTSFLHTPDWSSILTNIDGNIFVGVFLFKEHLTYNSNILQLDTVSIIQPLRDDKFRMRRYDSDRIAYESRNAYGIQLIGEILRDHADKNNHRTHSSS